MSTTQPKQTYNVCATPCPCPNGKHQKDIIVITIETCCPKSCNTHRKGKTLGSDSSDQEAPVNNLAKEPSSKPPESRKQSSVKPIIEPSKQKIGDAAESTDYPPDSEPEEAPVKEKSAVKIPDSEPEEAVKEKSTIKIKEKVFQLPIVTGRHHGKGCAMEISVLEKHQDSCIYKKSDNDGRNIEDKVGSYECIGRLVFKTCSDSDARQGAALEEIQPPKDEPRITGVKAPPSTSNVSRRSSRLSLSRKSRSGSSHTLTKNEVVQSKSGSADTLTRTEVAGPKASADTLSQKGEQVVLAATQVLNPLIFGKFIDKEIQSVGPKKRKRHLGDSHRSLPINPHLWSTGQFEKIYSSDKVFPKYADGGNQTDSTGDSFDTISSLTEVKNKKKSSFLGLFFRRGSRKSIDNIDAKKCTKK